MQNPYKHEFVRYNDGVVEHALFTSQLDGTVIVSLDLMTEMLMSLGFRPVDTASGDVVVSSDEQTVPTTAYPAG